MTIVISFSTGVLLAASSESRTEAPRHSPPTFFPTLTVLIFQVRGYFLLSPSWVHALKRNEIPLSAPVEFRQLLPSDFHIFSCFTSVLAFDISATMGCLELSFCVKYHRGPCHCAP